MNEKVKDDQVWDASASGSHVGKALVVKRSGLVYAEKDGAIEHKGNRENESCGTV